MPQRKFVRWWVLLAAVAAVNPLPTAAQLVGGCPAPPPLPDFEPIPADAPMMTRVRADEIQSEGEIVELTGNVELYEADKRLTADRIKYNRATAEVEAQGNVTLEDLRGDQLRSPEVYLQLDTLTGYTAPGTYRIGPAKGRGDAQRITLEGRQRLGVRNGRYTTCPQGNDDWYLSVRDLQLDREHNVGTARHAVIKFKRVPLFYWPWIRFPLADQRETGFLFPHVGTSDKRGTEFGWPFYWNIAPNFDDTITPTYMSKRGLQLTNKFRYLGHTLSGELGLQGLADDKETGTNRGAINYLHRQSIGRFWRGNVRFNRVSDDNYLDDFGNSLELASLTTLPQEADFEYRGRVWDFRARLLAFQTIDPTIALDDRPYDRLPQLLLTAHPGTLRGGLLPHFDGEVDYFQREQSLEGTRVDLWPGLSWPLRRSYGFFIPKISVKYIGYDLDVPPSQDDQPNATVPLFSLDNGLIFERSGRRFNQTLEPRLFYLFVPFKEQDNLPNFDTSIPEITFDNLFRENRFVGGDRVGDTNQATLALTTRTIGAQDGIEHFRFSIGQTFFFADRKVNLPAEIDTDNTSDVVAEVSATLARRWYTRATIDWDPDLRRTQRSSVLLQYQPARDRIINAGYRLRRDDNVEQVELSTQWPIKSRWTVAASTKYDLVNERNLETFMGFGYRSCCWAIRLFAQRRLDTEQRQVSDVKFEFELSGLSKLGDVPKSPLNQSIFFPSQEFATQGPGYR